LLLRFNAQLSPEPALPAAADVAAPSMTDSAIACEAAGKESAEVKTSVKMIPRRTVLFMGYFPQVFSRSLAALAAIIKVRVLFRSCSTP
jgi:hypothetical protein